MTMPVVCTACGFEPDFEDVEYEWVVDTNYCSSCAREEGMELYEDRSG